MKYYTFRTYDFIAIEKYIKKFNIRYQIIVKNKNNTVMCFNEKYDDINRMRCTYFEEYLYIHQINYKQTIKKI